MYELSELILTDLDNAKSYSKNRNCKVWAASNGTEIIWSDSPSQVYREGFKIFRIFENGQIVI